MTALHFSQDKAKEPLRKERFFCAVNNCHPERQRGIFSGYSVTRSLVAALCRDDKEKHKESGNVLFYVFLAVGLLAALTYAFVRDSRENYASQSAVSIAEAVFVQTNLLRSAIQQCAMEFPEGGGDTDGDGTITTADNPNNPYPLIPSSPLNTTRKLGVPPVVDAIAAAPDNSAKYLSCVGAPSAQAKMFQGTNTQGRFLPPPPAGFSEWTYANDATGVSLQIIAPSVAASMNALNRIMTKFATCQADLNYGGCGAGCFRVWILRASCP